MSIGPLDSDAVESYREAGAILVETMNEAREMIEPGVTQLEVAEYAEDAIREAGAGLAFPVNISVDEAASHATPARDDDTEFGEEMICLDIGVHVDGYIADAAVTVDYTGSDDLVEASETALEAAVEAVAPGVPAGEVGGAIENAIESYGYTPILNLTGHGVERYDAHTGPSIPNRAVDRSVELEVGDVLAIEPFATDGRGKVGEGATEEIYEQVGDGSVRDRRARQVMDELEAFDDLPFAARWLDSSRSEMALRTLKNAEIVKGYPVLKEADGQLISQAEHTMIVTEDGCEVTTAGIHDFD
ncbi:type II methionyl aminopeptidase [Halonotius terrestris]|uniref:Methionine aminopeptidase n=1 Tax=Halonotius terrestris TaxID=2487750 RepID=A0A8J8PD11_9EURY|nr:type II methionyl aminopeptidase [Halonotius terrestris]TQQ81269.1 type II methionyl aminopeptidase [Halonotius terrestris]